MPIRVQLSRKKGWRKPEGAVVVSRPSKWGNPYKLDAYPSGMTLDDRRVHALDCFRRLLLGQIEQPAVSLAFTVDDVKRELAGKDLCCWCSLSKGCHADILLEIANS